jgi:hypothetical protein
VGGILKKDEPLVYAKLVVTVRSLLHATSPVQDYSLLENYMVHYVYPTWSALPHRGVGDAPVTSTIQEINSDVK